MKQITFTQYIPPNGKQVPNTIERPDDIADGGGWDLLAIKADIMKHKIRHGVRFAVIDYLYLIGDMTNESDEVARTTVLARGVKRIAMELEIMINLT